MVTTVEERMEAIFEQLAPVELELLALAVRFRSRRDKTPLGLLADQSRYSLEELAAAARDLQRHGAVHLSAWQPETRQWQLFLFEEAVEIAWRASDRLEGQGPRPRSRTSPLAF